MSHSRRSFVAVSSAAVAGMALAGPQETLASKGGPKAVTVPAAQQEALMKWPRYGPAEKEALHRMIDSGQFYPEIPLFEKDWKDYTGAQFVKAHMNYSSGLTSMYFALDLPPGSEIMVPSYTFFSTCLPMRFFGYVPVFVDVNPKTVCFDLEDANRKLTPLTKAVVVMHAWGLPCELDRISAWTKEKGLILLEDAAQAVGASMQGRKMGTWGLMGGYSLQATKVLPTIEGGVCFYQTREYYERATAFGNYDAPETFPADSPIRAYKDTGFGQKYRMHPFAAAVGRQQLRGLDERRDLVTANVRKLNDQLVELPGLSEPVCRRDQQRAYYYGNILFFDPAKAGFSRSALLDALNAEGVKAQLWNYPEQHRLTIYSEAKWWHHPPRIEPPMPGNGQVNAQNVILPLMYGEAPELIGQYVKAFQKVWAHRAELGKA